MKIGREINFQSWTFRDSFFFKCQPLLHSALSRFLFFFCVRATTLLYEGPVLFFLVSPFSLLLTTTGSTDRTRSEDWPAKQKWLSFQVLIFVSDVLDLLCNGKRSHLVCFRKVGENLNSLILFCCQSSSIHCFLRLRFHHWPPFSEQACLSLLR